MNLENERGIEGTKASPAKTDGESLAITSKDQQTVFKSAQSNDDVAHKVELVDSGAKPQQVQDGYPPGYQDLVYRTMEDPVADNLGNLLAVFNGMTDKMSAALKNPAIQNDRSFTKQNLDDVMKNPENLKKFSPLELKVMNVMSQYAENFFGPAKNEPLSRKDVEDAAKQAGILKEA